MINVISLGLHNIHYHAHLGLADCQLLVGGERGGIASLHLSSDRVKYFLQMVSAARHLAQRQFQVQLCVGQCANTVEV